MRFHPSLPILFALILFTFVASLTSTVVPTPVHAASDTTSASLLFVENVGQFDAHARYQVRGVGGTLWLAQDALWLTVLEPTTEPSAFPTQGVNLRLSFPGATPNPRLEPFDPLPTTISYFTGNDPAKWRADVPVWGGVRYVDLYPGIDLELSGASGQFQPRLVVRAPEALNQVRLKVEGAEGITLHDGAIQMSSAVGDVVFPLLEVVGADGVELSASAVPIVSGEEVLMPFGNHQPQGQGSLGGGLIFSTFLGSVEYDRGWAVAVDSVGDAYMTGDTASTTFPTTPGTFDPNANGMYDTFVSKFSTDGSTLLYSTYLGGGNHDISWSIAVDGGNNAYLTGFTSSTNFPTTAGAVDTSYNGGQDAFVTKLNASGTALVYSTFLGGTALDEGGELTLDGAGRAYVTGTTESPSYPTTAGVVDPTYNGGGDMFITVLNTTGSTLDFSTYIGGGDVDSGWGIAVDGTGGVYVTGYTESSNFPATSGAYDTSFNGSGDLFVTKVNAVGSSLVYSTYLGDGNVEDGSAIVVDDEGSAYVTGYTFSTNFPTTSGAYDTTHNGDTDVFVSKINPTGTSLTYSTFLGGQNGEDADDMTIDGNGNVYLVGYTLSNNFPTSPGAYDPTYNAATDVFVAKLAPSGNTLLYGSFLGGNEDDYAYANALDATGVLVFTGLTFSSNFPTTIGAYDTTFNGLHDGFLTKFETSDTVPTPTPTGTLSATPTRTPTNTPTVTRTPTVTYTPSVTHTPSATLTPTATRTPTITPTLVPDAPEINTEPFAVYEAHPAPNHDEYAHDSELGGADAYLGNHRNRHDPWQSIDHRGRSVRLRGSCDATGGRVQFQPFGGIGQYD